MLASVGLTCAVLVGCGDDTSTTGSDTGNESTTSESSCAVAEPRTELLIVACQDEECRFPSEDPWGPPHNGAGAWTTTCTVAASQLIGDGALEVTLDSCTPVTDGWTPATIRVALDAALGGSAGLVAGRRIELVYRSSRDELSWIWRGWFLRDENGKLLIARAKGRPPPADAFESDALSVSLLDCPPVTDYCGSTLRHGALYLRDESGDVTVPEGQQAAWQRADGTWDVAVARARSYEGAACGSSSDYVSVDFAITALAEP